MFSGPCTATYHIRTYVPFDLSRPWKAEPRPNFDLGLGQVENPPRKTNSICEGKFHGLRKGKSTFFRQLYSPAGMPTCTPIFQLCFLSDFFPFFSKRNFLQLCLVIGAETRSTRFSAFSFIPDAGSRIISNRLLVAQFDKVINFSSQWTLFHLSAYSDAPWDRKAFLVAITSVTSDVRAIRVLLHMIC